MLRLKTKIAKRRVEIKLAKKKHNLIRCKCLECGKKKWSQYNKRSSKVICLTILNLIVWAVSIDGYTNWYASRGVWTFEAAAVRAQEKGQESIKDSAEAPIIDPSAVSKPTATVSENQRGNEYTHLPSSLSDIEAKILEAFNGDKVALAVAKGESGLDPNAKGWNCYYHKTTGEVLTSDEAAKTPKNLRESKSCKEEHRKFAWSVDCGVWQINSLTKECPEHLMDAEVNIAIAKEMQSKRGWSPWVAYWNGQYKNHMN